MMAGRVQRRLAALAAAAALPLAALAGGADSAATAAGGRGCVSVEAAGHRGPDLNCLNAQLSASADQQAQRNAALQAVVDGSRPATPAGQGLYTQAATRERLGDAFGHSVVPQRPQVQYNNPLIAPAHH
ncbi:MAG: hypothetical protein ISP90_03540 [Nevskia sp.]|nr:hypothetical protein [Nevskia sp.]